MSFVHLGRPLLRAAGLLLLLAASAAPGSPENVLARIDVRTAASVPDSAGSRIEVLQKLQTCLIVRIPEELSAELTDRGIGIQVLDSGSGDRPYFLVRYAAADDIATIASFGEVRLIEEGVALFWTGSENAREVLPPEFALKRLPDKTSLTAGPSKAVPAARRIQADVRSPAIAHLVGQVSRERLTAVIQKMQDFGTRFASTQSCESAGEYIHSFFSGLGLATRYEQVRFGRSSTYYSRNVVAEIPGRTSPEYSVILCAHYDSYNKNGDAPGADDNASGTAAVLEMARILAGYSFDFTVKFVCFSAEEWGLYGSRQYAAAARAADEKILGVLNLDMVAYADDFPEDLEVFSNPESEWLLNRFAAAAANYTALQVVPRVDASMWGSDHSPFWDQGFSALCAIEDSPLSNPNYHTATDTVDTLDFELLTSATQATLAAAADLAQPLPILSCLPQIADGSVGDGSLRTTFVLFNNTDHETTVDVKLTGDDGGPLSVHIPGLGTGSGFTLSLRAGASRMIQTDGSGSLVTGYATVTSAVPIGVSSIFTTYDARGHFVAEAGVGASSPVREFVVPVDSTGDYSTGLALVNSSSATVAIELKLLDTSGREAGQSTLSMAPGAHRADFVTGAGQLFAGVTAFRGVLAVRSSGPVSALALRQTREPLSYTSFPVLAEGSAGHARVLPHIAEGTFGGGSFRTSFLVVNPSPAPAAARLSLLRSDGTPLNTMLLDGGAGSSFDLNLSANGSIFLQTDGSGPLTTGAATMSSDAFGVFGIFSVLDAEGRFQSEAGVPAAAESSSFTLPVDVTASFNTGVALFNPGSLPVQLALKLLDESGELVAGTEFPLAAGRQKAMFVTDLFPGTSSFRGSLAVSGGSVAALVLRQNTSPLAYTTLPVKEGVPTR